MKLLTVIGACLMLLSTAKAQTPSTHVFKKTDTEDLSLDVYAADNHTADKKPVIILFHGGGFVGGDKKDLGVQCAYFASKGLVAVTASYRLIPRNAGGREQLVPRCIKDAKSAVRWVKQHAGEFNIDTAQVILGGGSAGGFLATEAALNNDINDEGDNIRISTKCLALVLFNPAYIPQTLYAPAPVNYINAHTPPSILFFGDQDHYKPGGDAFYNELRKNGVTAELWVAPGQAHAFYNKSNWKITTQVKAAVFLAKLGLIKAAVNDPAPETLVFQQPAK